MEISSPSSEPDTLSSSEVVLNVDAMTCEDVLSSG